MNDKYMHDSVIGWEMNKDIASLNVTKCCLMPA